MYGLWLLPALFCLIYYGCCAVHAGTGSSFITVWLIGAVFFIGLFLIRLAMAKGVLSIPVWMVRIFAAFMAAVICSFLVIEALIIVHFCIKPYEQCDYIIILGCRVKGTEVSKSLRARLDAAIDYIQDDENVQIIVSGGKGSGEDISEALAMKNYLVERGVRESRILMEDQSVDTSENIRFSAEHISNKEAAIGVVSNDFHLFRAKQLVQAQGFTHVCGIAAPTDQILFCNYMFREYFGVLKDLFTGNMFR